MLDLLNMYACICLLLNKRRLHLTSWTLFAKNEAAFNWVIFWVIFVLDKFLYGSNLKISFTISSYVLGPSSYVEIPIFLCSTCFNNVYPNNFLKTLSLVHIRYFPCSIFKEIHNNCR